MFISDFDQKNANFDTISGFYDQFISKHFKEDPQDHINQIEYLLTNIPVTLKNREFIETLANSDDLDLFENFLI